MLSVVEPVTAGIYELVEPLSLVLKPQPLTDRQLEPDELVATAEVSVISPGTEVAAWVGRPPLRPSTAYPRLVGYCHLARVTAVGSGVIDVAPGDGILTHQSHRSHVRVRRSEVLLVVRDADAEVRRALAATYLYHIGYTALIAGAYFPGHTVGIVGGGALGLATAQLAAACGADPVVFTDRARGDDDPMSRYRCMSKQVEPTVDDWSDLGGADLIINTSDGWEDFRLSQQACRPGGTIVLLGFPGRGVPAAPFNPLDSQFMYDKQLTVRHSGHVPQVAGSPADMRLTTQRNIAYLASLIRRGDMRVSDLVGAVVPWSELPQTYQRLAARPAGLYTAALDWTGYATPSSTSEY